MTHCPTKRKEYDRLRYERNRDQVIARTKTRNGRVRLEVKRLILGYLLDHPCVDCGEADPVVLDFDHVGVKRFGLSTAASNTRPGHEIMREIEQCEVRCANCHRRKTYAELGYWSRDVTIVQECAAAA